MKTSNTTLSKSFFFWHLLHRIDQGNKFSLPTVNLHSKLSSPTSHSMANLPFPTWLLYDVISTHSSASFLTIPSTLSIKQYHSKPEARMSLLWEHFIRFSFINHYDISGDHFYVICCSLVLMWVFGEGSGGGTELWFLPQECNKQPLTIFFHFIEKKVDNLFVELFHHIFMNKLIIEH